MLTVLENLLVFVINLLVIIIIVDALLSFITDIQTNKFVMMLRKASDLFTNPIRKILPVTKIGLDVAPLLTILILKLIQGVFIRLINMLV